MMIGASLDRLPKHKVVGVLKTSGSRALHGSPKLVSEFTEYVKRVEE